MSEEVDFEEPKTEKRYRRIQHSTFGIQLTGHDLQHVKPLDHRIEGINVKGYVLTSYREAQKLELLTVEEIMKRRIERHKEALRKAEERRKILRERWGEYQDSVFRRWRERKLKEGYRRDVRRFKQKVTHWIRYRTKTGLPINAMILRALGVTAVEPVIIGEWWDWPNIQYKVRLFLEDGTTVLTTYGTVKLLKKLYYEGHIHRIEEIIIREESGGNNE